MQLYQELLVELKSCSDEAYKSFHKRLLKNEEINVLGVRVPDLRKIAKKWTWRVNEILTFPDDFYEVTFIKLCVVSALKYAEFIEYVDLCVPLINNWATCDCFVPKCISNHRDEFLPYIRRYFDEKKEYFQRFALTTLLHFYVDGKYLNTIFELSESAATEFYYVHMAVAWLIAEVLVKYFDEGVKFLKCANLDKRTHNKAIQKATESFRLTDTQKNFLKGIKK